MKDDQVYLEYICLSLVNNLEVNEQILYARMMNIEQSTLIE